jgi:integrase
MRIYKAKYKDKNGVTKTVDKYRVALRIDGHLHRFVAFESKQACDILLLNMQALKNLRDAGLEPSKKLQLWFNELPQKIQNKLIELNLLDAKWGTSNKTLLDHIDDWEKHLRTKNSTDHYIVLVVSRVTNIMENCDFTYWRDISASTIENYVANIKLSRRTKNLYLQSVKQFGTWIVKDQRASESDNPLKYLETVQVLNRDLKHPRRAITLDEMNHLLEVTKAGPELYGMSGYERWLLYQSAILTGLRRNELRSLTKSSFDFKNNTVFLAGDDAKNRHEAIQSITKELSLEFERYLSNKLPAAPVFKGTYNKHTQLTTHTAKMLKADLKRAGIPYVLDKKYFDFHSLRHQCGTLLAASGVSPKTAMDVMRHSDINLTMSLYTHTLIGQKQDAITKAFSNVGKPSKSEKEKNA